ncbi:MAG TPA: immunoglobulin domain-containing protein [Candidatus Paceibacterota bacterium]|nr:immunoglobulin domain-containing protein [Verrucomicrobiota bacterium]HSA08737.1 immunoglobulin domain-containing protein [Candidatus Paceibacterota bacterium]
MINWKHSCCVAQNPYNSALKTPTLTHGLVAALLVLCHLPAPAAPFARRFAFTQPDGTQIVLWGQGDEFHAVFETLDGYTVVFNQKTGAYDYAGVSADGAELVSTGVAVGHSPPATPKLKPHVRINPLAAKRQAAERYARWDQALEISQRWNALKSARRLADLAETQKTPASSPPPATTTGHKLGLTLLIDFSDDVATIPQADIIDFCNGDNYTGYGNNGSVKSYFLDVSNQQLTYSNVVTIYIRAPQPKSYYNDVTADEWTQGRLLTSEAIAAMKALANYTTEILPTFANLTVDASSNVLVFNVFFAGASSSVWQKGLWPHPSSLVSPIDLGNGKAVLKYQITNIGAAPTLGTFCHESGHLLCGFPDLYDEGLDSIGGAGAFCLMGYGLYDTNPVQVSAYLKRAAGWATTLELTTSSVLTASVSSSGPDFNKFYRCTKPGTPTEYYLVENRQQSGRDASLPGSGVAIWHVDELGDKDNQSTNFNNLHLNYELSLVQADNSCHLQNNSNFGDAQDLYFLGNTAADYSNRLSDASSPAARWWDGSASGILFHHFSDSGTTMTFGVGPEEPVIGLDNALLSAEGCLPTNSVIDPNETVTVNFALRNIGGGGTTNLVATLLTNKGLIWPSAPQTYGELAANGPAVSLPFSFTAIGNCGGNNVATLQLQDGAENLGTVNFWFQLGQSSLTNVWSQNFDDVIAPALPANWTSVASDAQSAWISSISSADTAPNALFSPDPGNIGVNELNSPGIALPASLAQLSFRHRYNLETIYDGGVLEIKIADGPWTDILLAGGSFVSGGYVGTLSTLYGNPLGGRSAWTGDSAGFITTLVNLPSAASGQIIQLRWRCGSDSSTGAPGWFVDTLSVTSTNVACCILNPDLQVALTASPDPVVAGQNLAYTLTVTNLGPEPAISVTLTDTLPASVTFVSASPGCVHLGGQVVATVDALAAGSASNFTVVVTPNAEGLITNTLSVASLTPDPNSDNNSATNVTTVFAPPTITVQPDNQTVLAGSNAVFQVTAAGTAPLSYQWRFNGTNLADAVDLVLTLTNVEVAQAGTYAVLVTNDFGSVLSTNAVLTVMDPFIVAQPQDQAVAAGATATFVASAGGTLPLSYQWRRAGSNLADGENISGAQTASLTVSNVQSADMGNYSVLVTNINGWVASSNAALTAPFPPVILAQPASQTAVAGSAVSFTIEAAGPNLAFQWTRGGTNLVDGGKINGSATASLTVSNAQAADMAAYSVGVSNSYGSVVSSNALLALWPLVGWGNNVLTQADIPPGLNGVAGVAGGLFHSLALKADGTVVAWGAGRTNSGLNPQFGQAVVPDGLNSVVSLAAGFYHSLALLADGTVSAWGAGTTNSGANPHYGQAIVPAIATNVTAVAAGAYHSLVLKSDGTVIAWGAGASNLGSTHFGQSAVPSGLSNVVAIAAGIYHSLALRSDGTVVGWGAGTNNTGLIPDFGQSQVPDGLSDVVAIAGGGYHSLALQADGAVTAWGAGTNNTGGNPDFGQSQVPEDLTNVAAISAGLYHSLVLKADGTVAVWGLNNNGQTNTPGLLSNGMAVAGGGYHTLALEGGGSPHFTVQPFARAVTLGTTVKLTAIAAGQQPLSYQWQHAGTNLDGAISHTLTLDSVQCSDAGAYTLLASNSLGTTASSTAALTIAGAAPPTITCPADVMVPADPGACTASGVALGSPLTDDPCGTATVTNNGIGSYPLGTNVVTWTITDAVGNTNSCQQHVIVLDVQAPTISCPTNLVVSADAGQCSMSNVTWEVAASDNCAVASVVSEPPSGSTFPAGVTTVNCTATDASGNTNSCSFTVTVVSPSYVLAQPVSQIATQGGDAAFTVIATNECGIALTYQWRWNGGDIAGATDSVYTRTNVQCADAGSFEVVVSSLGSSLTSSAAALTVVAPPMILSNPADQAVPLGEGVTFCLSATNDCGGQLDCQWRFQGIEIPGATTNCYTLAFALPANAGNYDAVVANLAAAVTSPAAVLTVVGPELTVYPGDPSPGGGGSTNLFITFPSVTGVDSVVQYKDALLDTNDWLPLTTNPGTGSFITNDFPVSTELSGRFYRIQVP